MAALAACTNIMEGGRLPEARSATALPIAGHHLFHGLAVIEESWSVWCAPPAAHGERGCPKGRTSPRGLAERSTRMAGGCSPTVTLRLDTVGTAEVVGRPPASTSDPRWWRRAYSGLAATVPTSTCCGRHAAMPGGPRRWATTTLRSASTTSHRRRLRVMELILTTCASASWSRSQSEMKANGCIHQQMRWWFLGEDLAPAGLGLAAPRRTCTCWCRKGGATSAAHRTQPKRHCRRNGSSRRLP